MRYESHKYSMYICHLKQFEPGNSDKKYSNKRNGVRGNGTTGYKTLSKEISP